MQNKAEFDDAVFDFNFFESRFPVSTFPIDPWDCDIIDGPESIIVTERFRHWASAQVDLGPTVPCDIFVLGRGEPPRRNFTKIGGLPFRPARLPWPLGSTGQPMTFLAQFNFTGSRDLFDALPGDVLLIFSEDDDICSDDPQEKIRFEWYPADLQEELISADAIVETDWKIGACYGVLHRTCDYSAADAPERLAKVLSPTDVKTRGALGAAEGIDILIGTKIGGLPFSGRRGKEASPWNGRLLCTVSSVWEARDIPYPWVNQEAIVPLFSGPLYDPLLEIRAGFAMEFFLEPDGTIKWWIQFLP